MLLRGVAVGHGSSCLLSEIRSLHEGASCGLPHPSACSAKNLGHLCTIRKQQRLNYGGQCATDRLKRKVTACMAAQPIAAHADSTFKSSATRVTPHTMTAWVAAEASRGGSGGRADMVLLFSAVQSAVKRIASLVRQAGITDLSMAATPAKLVSDQRDAPKPLDLVANDILKAALAETGLVAVMASEEEDSVVEVPLGAAPGEEGGTGRYIVVFDPLDGSRNIECSIPTGTIFGIYAMPPNATAETAVRQPGSALVGSGYALYSSATVAAVTLGAGRVAAFTLDPATGDFVTSQPDMRIPKRGQIYSLNDARYWDWPLGLRAYVDDVRQGKGQNPKQYSARYVCSLVADLHRTIMYGGWCGNPRSHLRLVYEAAPLAFLVEQAGGEGSDGQQRILDIVPESLHQRLPLFLGSPDDIRELLSYGDVQQTSDKKYEM